MKKKLSFVISIVFLFGISYNTTSAEIANYEYPNLSSDEWGDLLDHNEKVAACQLPEKLIESLSTDELLEAVLDYPLLFEIYAYNDEQVGFEAVFADFNGLQELFTRDDVGQVVYDKYCATEVMEDATKSKESEDFLELAYLEIILMQNSVLNQFELEEISEVLNEVEYKYSIKSKHPDIYSLTANTAYKVLEFENNLIKNTLVSPTATGTVYTPKGSAVSVFNFTPELSSSEKIRLKNQVKSAYPDVTVKSEATRNYNCHSYAWYSQSTSSNKWWMNYPSKYMTDGSYSKTISVKVGRRIYYGASGNEHSGIVSGLGRQGFNSYITSKWGQLPLIYHFYTDCPYWTGNYDITFWTR